MLKRIYLKLKSIKNIELYVAVFVALAVLAIVLIGGAEKKSLQNADDNSYISQMEHKICNVVEKIAGCGKATVAISYSSNEEKQYAYETEISTSGGVVKQTDSLVSVKGEPLVTKVLPPKILGVVVVAQGADNPIVRMKIVDVVVTLLGVSTNDVQVFTYKS